MTHKVKVKFEFIAAYEDEYYSSVVNRLMLYREAIIEFAQEQGLTVENWSWQTSKVENEEDENIK